MEWYNYTSFDLAFTDEISIDRLHLICTVSEFTSTSPPLDANECEDWPSHNARKTEIGITIPLETKLPWQWLLLLIILIIPIATYRFVREAGIRTPAPAFFVFLII